MEDLPKKITTKELTKIIQNIGYVNPDCLFRIPADNMCHSSREVNYEAAIEEIDNLHNHYLEVISWDIWAKYYNEKGLVYLVCITAHNHIIDKFNPSGVGGLD